MQRPRIKLESSSQLDWKPGGLRASEDLTCGKSLGLTCEQLNGATDVAGFWTTTASSLGARAVELARWCLIPMSKFARIDLRGNWRDHLDVAGRRQPPLGKRARNLCSGSAWVQLVRLFFLYFTIKLALQTFLQQAHNVHRFNVKRLSASVAASESVGLNQKRAALGQQLEVEQASLARAFAALELVGAPYLEFTFGIVALNVYLIAITYLNFMHTQLFFALGHPFDFSVARAFLAGNLEQRHQINGAICAQVNGFLASSANFLKGRLHELELMLGVRERRLAVLDEHHASFRLNDAYNELYERKAAGLARRQAAICSQLRQLALTGRLQPPNRNGAWLGKLALLYLLILGAIFCAGSSVINASLLVLPFGGLVAGKRVRRGPRDLLMAAEMYLYSQIALFSVMFYLPLITISCADQIHHALALMRNIDATIAKNDLWLERGRLRRQRRHLAAESRHIEQGDCSPGAGQEKSLEFQATLERPVDSDKSEKTDDSARQEQLNVDLVVVLLQFKLFVQQMCAVKPSAGLGSSICIVLMSVVPIISRLFAHHLETDLKLLLLVDSLVFILFGDLLILPNCYLHSRCLDLYKRLSRLMARSVEVMHVHGGSARNSCEGQVYDCHTIWLLRKELSLPEKSLSKFVPTALYQQLNFASLLRVHFWCGLLLISMLFADNSKQTDGFMDDSLRLF